MKVTAIVPCAGSGRRMRSSTDKPFIRLLNKEIIFYTLRTLNSSPEIAEIIVAARKENISRIKLLVKREGFTKVRDVVIGGRCRSASVFNALSKASPDADYILVHDGARPLVDRRLIEKVLKAATSCGASMSAVRITSTVKEAGVRGGLVKRTLDRRCLWAAQTPQAVRKDILVSAYREGVRLGRFTDEASLVEETGRSVKVVEGSYSNIKITTPEDLAIAEALMKRIKVKVAGAASRRRM